MVAKQNGQNSLGGTTGCDDYEVRPRKSEDGVELISDRFRYGPIWYAGPDAVRNAVAYAKYRSLLRSHRANIRVLDDFGAVLQTHSSNRDFRRWRSAVRFGSVCQAAREASR